MLSSSGSLKNIICPFYKSGLCERPHCHFKHSSDNKESGSADFREEPEDLEDSDVSLTTSSTPVASPPSKMLVPKPVTPPSRSYLPISCVPQYKPTPLEELRKMKKTAATSATPASPKSKRHIPYDPTKTVVHPRVLANVKNMDDDDSDCSAKFSDEEEAGAAAAPQTKSATASAAPPPSKHVVHSVGEKLKCVFEIINSSHTETKQKSCDAITPETSELPQSSEALPTPDTLCSNSHPVSPKEEHSQEFPLSKKTESDPSLPPDTPETAPIVNNHSLKTCNNHQRELSEEKIPASKENEVAKEKADKAISTSKGKENKDAKETKKAGGEKNKSHPKEKERRSSRDEKDEKKKMRERSSSKDSIETKEKVVAKDIHNRSSRVKDFKSSIKDKEPRKSKNNKEDASNKNSKKPKQAKTVEQTKTPSSIEKPKKDLAEAAAKDGEKKKPSTDKHQAIVSSPDKKKHLTNPEKQKSSEKPPTEKSRDSRSSDSTTRTVEKCKSDPSKTKSKDSENSSRQNAESKFNAKVSRASDGSASMDRTHNDSSNSSEKFSSRSSQERAKPKSSAEKVKNSSSSSKRPHSTSHHSKASNDASDKKQPIAKRPKEESNNRADSKISKGVGRSKSALPKEVEEEEHCPAKIPRRDSPPAKTKPERQLSGEDLERISLPQGVKRKNGQSKTISNPELENILSAVGNCSDKGDETLKECWEIFNEDELMDSGDESSHKKAKLEEETAEDIGSKRKRFAHQPDLKRDQVPKIKPARPSPFQIMQQRLQQAQQQQQKYADTPSPLLQKKASAFLQSFRPAEKKKTSIQGANPNIHLLAAVNRKMQQPTLTLPNDLNPDITSCMSTAKGARRLAHIPALPTKPRPSVTLDGSSRVPFNIRQRYLNSMIDELLKLCKDEDEAYKQALEEESKAYARANNRQIYLNIACNIIQRLRRRLAEESGVTRPVVATNDVILGGAIAARTSFSIEKKVSRAPIEIEGPLLYRLLKPYLMTPQQLEDNNYPLLHPTDPNKASYPHAKILSPTLEKTCCRCQRKFSLDEEGRYVRTEECTYHWGRMYKKKIAGSWESRYNCCGMDGESDGCCSSQGHVWEGMEESHLEGYVTTAARKTAEPGVFGLDCEMAYTTNGLELIRVSVVNSRLQSVYETLVKPVSPVLDYNTRFSGLTAEDLAHVTTRLHNVQAALLNLFSDRSILVGHSLESDLRALKLIHRRVVDTSLVFPHRLGLPYKRSLRNLMAEHCSKIIQNDVEGHDSKEDASAAMELILLKLREDAKRASR